MNKFLFLFWLLTAAPLWAQDSLATAEKKTVTYTENDIRIDQNSVVIPTKFPSDYKEKYKDSDFQYEVQLEEKSLWDKFKEWLAYWFRKIFGLSDMNVSKNYVEITLKVIAALIVIYVIYLIVKIILNKEGQWVFGKSTTKKIIHDDDIEKNLVHVDFEKLIAQTLKEGNNRLAVRYYYLWVLKRMSEKSIIEWHADKTNTDYVYEIQSSDLRSDFQYLSYLYNYIWYGEFEMTEPTFRHAKKAFETTIQSLRL
ncbi:DUF4129 domain-containing protein [Flavobacterium sedimenticola]|uniref:DUF4129 domain-containing protein n=1 Tax=Flavobacterium sedimenticola TaxID=3043286 RepID=A0ABT6XT23_9FLAO|nr:DUF4129 domain-containing protein [Flavobacterium sedimenticola]MDI9258249.1 DUF4129 domain-containing protein [Flavobacterium sedimenticola]